MIICVRLLLFLLLALECSQSLCAQSYRRRSMMQAVVPASGGGGGGTGDPTDVSSLAIWYEPSKLTGTNDGESLTQLRDLSGHGYHATSGGTAPKYTNGAVNSLAAVRLDGNGYWQIPNVLNTVVTAADILIVAKCDFDTSGVGGLWQIGGGPSPSLLPFNGDIYENGGREDRLGPFNPTAPMTSWFFYVIRTKAGAWTNTFNGEVLGGTATATTTFPTDPFLGFNGSASYWSGYIAVMEVYTQTLDRLTFSNRVARDTNRFGIPGVTIP